MTTTFICENCGDSVEKYKSNTGKNVFCNRNCYGEFKDEKVEVECSNCQKTFKKKKKEIKKYNNHFCNKKCQGEFLSDKVKVECSFCEDELFVTPYKIKRQGNFFCGRECWGGWSSEYRVGENASNWRGGHVRDYGPNWDSERKEALQRDNWECLRCGMDIDEHYKEYDMSLIVHHIVPLKTFNRDFESANDVQNLATICLSCHQGVEILSPDEQKKILFGEKL